MLLKVLQFFADYFLLIAILLFGGISYWGITQTSRRQKQARKILDKAIQTNSHEPISLHPQIDPVKCAGCGACTRVCPEGDILQMVHHKAVLVSPGKCVGHGECEVACPFGAIELVFGTRTRGQEIPRLNTNYETNVPGLYIVGELGGMGLIRNAVKQGNLAATHALKARREQTSKAQYDVLIVGAGPAGLASALTAISMKAKYLVIDQNTLGGTVANFPRQKVVMSYPAELPIVGQMKFSKNKISKEDLLDYWSDVCQKTGLKISEREKFEGLTQQSGMFVVKTSKGSYTARKVILAMGVRGTPRRLGLKNEDLPKVTYNLLDPEQYQNCNVAVIGGGNAGVEAAQYLSKSKYGNKVTLLIHGATLDRCNDENREKIEERQRMGKVEICYNSQVTEIHKDRLVVKKEGQPTQIKNDFLFVFIGAEVPQAFLSSLGVKFEKKFGEALKSGS